MGGFTAQDVQKLRQATGAGMMDAKKALQETDGDFEAAGKWLREKGMASAAKRSDRENSEGAVGLAILDNKGAIVELKCETDFVAKSEEFVNLANDLAAAVAESGDDAVNQRKNEIDELNSRFKENIALGQVVRFEAPSGSVVGGYLHVQNDRGVNGVLVEIVGSTKEMAHDVCVHIAFARPPYLTREEIPAETIASERETFAAIAKNEGKPEAAMEKIVDGRMTGFFKENCLLDQAFVRDEKKTIAQLVGDGSITRFSQVEIGQ